MPKQKSVGDVAFELGVHERVVIEWAEERDLAKVGREYIFTPRDVRRLEKWLEEDGEPSEGAEPHEDEADDDAKENDEGDEEDEDEDEGDEDER